MAMVWITISDEIVWSFWLRPMSQPPPYILGRVSTWVHHIMTIGKSNTFIIEIKQNDLILNLTAENRL